MTTVITKLSDDLKIKLNTAEEIWVAVALLSLQGQTFIQDNLSKTCKQNYLVGLDLPTDPKALYKLFHAQLISDTNVKVYTDKECYHPKLYLERVREFKEVGAGSIFVVTKLQRYDKTVQRTDRHPMGCNITIFKSKTQTKGEITVGNRCLAVHCSSRMPMAKFTG